MHKKQIYISRTNHLKKIVLFLMAYSIFTETKEQQLIKNNSRQYKNEFIKSIVYSFAGGISAVGIASSLMSKECSITNAFLIAMPPLVLVGYNVLMKSNKKDNHNADFSSQNNSSQTYPSQNIKTNLFSFENATQYPIDISIALLTADMAPNFPGDRFKRSLENKRIEELIKKNIISWHNFDLASMEQKNIHLDVDYGIYIKAKNHYYSISAPTLGNIIKFKIGSGIEGVSDFSARLDIETQEYPADYWDGCMSMISSNKN